MIRFLVSAITAEIQFLRDLFGIRDAYDRAVAEQAAELQRLADNDL